MLTASKAWTLCSLMLAVCLLAGISQAQDIPTLSARTLGEKTVTLPEAFVGHITVLVVGFTRSSQSPCAAWGKRLTQELTNSDVQLYQAAVLQDVPRLFRGMVISGIRKGVPASQHDRFLVLTERQDEWKKLAQFSEPDAAYVLLIDRAGKIVWITHRAADDNALSELRAQIAVLGK